jgi:hypothetical protein
LYPTFRDSCMSSSRSEISISSSTFRPFKMKPTSRLQIQGRGATFHRNVNQNYAVGKESEVS